MPTKRIVYIFAILLVLSVLLSALVYLSGPRVRDIRLINNPNSHRKTDTSIIELVFDRPIEQKDYTSLITFSPELKFTARTTSQGMYISLHQNLLHATNYRLTIDSGIKDSTGRAMKNAYQYDFSTPAAKFAFLQRVYEGNGIDSIQLVSTQNGATASLFSAPVIRSFAINERYLAIVESTNLGDVLHVNDYVKNRTVYQKQFSEKVSNISLAPLSSRVIYSTLPDFNEVSFEYYKTFAHRLYSLDINTEQITPVLDDLGSPLTASELILSQDGSVALIRNGVAGYFAISTFSDNAPVPLGEQGQSFGFSRDGSQLFFQQTNSVVVYDSATTKSSKLAYSPKRGYIKQIDLKNDSPILAIVDYDEIGDAVSTIQKLESPKDKSANQLWSGPVDLRDFQSSFDGRYGAIHYNPKGCTYDDVLLDSQCTLARVLLVDFTSGEVIGDFDGFSPIWIP